ncbi:MAG: S8 family serine peptidase [Anaerolineae bacterium]|nr:S8 family serine peptidase [Anaerolineae bacterium]
MKPLGAPLPPDLKNSVADVRRLFTLSEQRLDRLRLNGATRSNQPQADLNLWFQITLKSGVDAADFIRNLRSLNSVEIAEPAPLPAPPAAITPDFTANQGYLNGATAGIHARDMWTVPGGDGSGITIYDVEYSWNQTHEDLSKANGVALLVSPGDTASDPFFNNNHGTAVLGELIATNNSLGVTGIAWGSSIGLVPAYTVNLSYNPANAILLAVADGSPGDVILLEQQFPVCGLSDYGPVEWINSVFDAIQTATANGLVVVEAAGNGNVDLDQAACGTAFNRTVRDSGAIIVGAGGAPTGSSDRERLSFSSYGSRVDLQGWGQSVMTTGYGTYYVDPDNPINPNRWYSSTFNGTSSASPIVAGSAAILQGIAKEVGILITPAKMRTVLVQTGSPQLGDTTEHIGPRPNLQQASLTLFVPDLTATNTSSTGSSGLVGVPFTWQVTVANTGTGSAIFEAGKTILIDNLPASGAIYGAPTVNNSVNVTNAANIVCTIVANNLSCTANGANVTLGPITGQFKVSFKVTPTVGGSLRNPRTNGLCRVDPQAVVSESNENNNNCGQTIIIRKKTYLPLLSKN